MSANSFNRIFRPTRIAVIGASEKEASVGGIVLRNLLAGGFEGDVYPVNPKHDTVRGLKCYERVSQAPEPVDLALIATPASSVPDLVADCGQSDVGGVVIFSAGFGEVGEESEELTGKLKQQSERFPEMRIIGPNCVGIIVPSHRMNASFAVAAMPPEGDIALVSQSGALCTSILDWALEANIGFSYFVSAGNMLDVGFGDLLGYFAEQNDAQSAMLYMESLRNAECFMSAARGFSQSCPIVAYKAGRFSQSAQAAASHTGAMAGEDAVFDAAFRRVGIERVLEVDDLFRCAQLLAMQKELPTGKLAIVTNAGGPGVMAVDALVARKGKLAELSEQTLKKLDEVLPPAWSRGNPVDVLGDAQDERYAEATRIVLEDAAVNAALVILTPQAMTDPTAIAEAIIKIGGNLKKPILTAWMGAEAVNEGAGKLEDAGIPTYRTPEAAIHAFTHLVAYTGAREAMTHTGRQKLEFSRSKDQRRKHALEILKDVEEDLSEIQGKRLLRLYDISVTMPEPAASPEEAAKHAKELGFPVAIKIASTDISHKTDVGGVALNLDDEAEVKEAYDRIIESVRKKESEAEIQGVTVQPMADLESPMELILGAKRDATFGSIVMVGMGGVLAEMIEDRAIELPPLNERLVRRMIESLQSWPLLEGYRDQPGVNLDRLIETILRFSLMIEEQPGIEAMDVNPLLASSDGTIAVDVAGRIDRSMLEAEASVHLAWV